jgi:tetratricopeptide (TPR) repeat protein
MMRGISLTIDRREAEAAAYLASAEREMPNAPELVYLLGEAQWHSQQLDTGVATLERAFQIDPRWQVSLHHVAEYRLLRGEAAKLRPLAETLRGVDPAAASTLDCRIAIGEGDHARAAAIARAALARDPIVELHICLSQALVLAGDLKPSGEAAQRAFELWPIDTREWGGFALHAEHLLYRGRLDEYLALVRGKPSRQRSLALAMWQPSPDLAEPDPTDRKIRTPPPLGAALWILIRKTQGHDEAGVYDNYGEPEVRLYGQGLWAEEKGDRAKAIARYREALTVPAKGDIHMLLSHHLARVLHANGDDAAAKQACEAVITPRVYHPYRAVLLPDCVLWSGDRATYQQIADAWQGSTFLHPSVVEIRKRLAAR